MKKIILTILVICSYAISLAQFANVTIAGSQVRKINSAIVNQEYELHIFLPAGYESGNKKYPVVYLMDSQWDFALLKSIYGQQYFDGFIPQLIIVGVTWGGLNPNPDSLRARDYTPTNDKRIVQSGGADKFLSFMQNELFPFIETNYKADAQNRILMGCSLGGLLTMYTLLTHASMFTGYAAASPAVGWDNGILYKYESAFAAQKFTSPLRVYMTVGDVERGKPVYEKFAASIDKYQSTKLNIRSKILENTGHSSTKTETYSRGLQYIFERPKLNISAAILNKYTGIYLLPDGSNAEIKNENNRLVIYFSPANKFDLFAESETSFYADAQFLKINFNDENNKTTGFNLEQYSGAVLVKKQNK